MIGRDTVPRLWIAVVIVAFACCGPGVSEGPAPDDGGSPDATATPDTTTPKPDTTTPTPDTTTPKPDTKTPKPDTTTPKPDNGTPVDCWCSPNSEHVNKKRAYLCANMSKYCAKGSDNDLGWYPLNAATETCVKQKQKDYFVKVESCPK
jgi:hypothetical protein